MCYTQQAFTWKDVWGKLGVEVCEPHPCSAAPMGARGAWGCSCARVVTWPPHDAPGGTTCGHQASLGTKGEPGAPWRNQVLRCSLWFFSSFLLCLLSGQLWLSAADKRSQRRMVSKMFLVLWHLLPAQWTSQHSASEAPGYSQACAPVQEKVKYVCEVLEGLCNADGCAQNSHACSLGHREPRWFIISSASIYYSCWRQGKVFDMYLKKLQIHKRDKFVWIVSPGV